MAIIKRCDGCGAESPDSRGLHVANHWTTLVLARTKSGFRHQPETVDEILLCEDCDTKARGALRVYGIKA